MNWKDLEAIRNSVFLDEQIAIDDASRIAFVQMKPD
jgi:hypothetical protein